MRVSEAVTTRRSIRAFLPTPVPDATIRELLELAARAPSGGNVQPWRVYVINGERMTEFLDFLDTRPPVEESEYEVYPAGLWDPHRTARYELGEQMYGLLGIGRDDKEGRLRQFARNGRFFDAPAAFFITLDRRFNQPQWSDLGMFLQTFMLLAVEAGLDTCPQEYWSSRHGAVTEFIGAPENEMLFCGMAIGHADRDAPVNTLVSERLPLDEWATWV
jgi:nitroreductase